VATHCETSEIVWLSRAYPGAKSEYKILEEIETLLVPGEKLMADRLFRFHKNCIVADPFPSDYTHHFDSIRSSVERRIGVLRDYAIVKNTFRGTSEECYAFHHSCVKVVCQLTNSYWNK